ncbi:polysaccharide biosynthesis/export family protein [Croceicoccus sediminis]|uniref:polysaccharide biosynthesis/export family protein n=1 Tax=Croceicoccus sediminis TaxID=2571150 RepID=UPI0014793B42|nr:polysaccharide biosynthesis/export family protein [Croceicoccus sediminis]
MNRIFPARLRVALCVVASSMGLAACQSYPDDSLARGADAYRTLEATARPEGAVYRIGPFDRLSISVYGEPSLSFAELPVDAEGRFDYPLIGSVDAAGLTTGELTRRIKARLDDELYNDARVTIFVKGSASQYVTVEGAVNEPGRFELPQGRATLLEMIAQAQSPSRTAKLDQVMVFRMEGGQRTGAVFNLVDIRTGAADDPPLRGGDMVVVNNSALKGAFRDFLLTAPFFNTFRAF